MPIIKPNFLNILPFSEHAQDDEHNNAIFHPTSQQLPTVEFLGPNQNPNCRSISVDECYQQLSDFTSGNPLKTVTNNENSNNIVHPQQQQKQHPHLQDLTPSSEVSMITTTTATSEYIESGYFSNSSCFLYFNDGISSASKNDGEEEENSSFNLDFSFFRTPAFIGALLLFTSLFIVLSAVLLWLQIFSSSSSNSSKLKFTFCTSRHLNSEQQLHCRQAFVRNMTLEAFHAYKRYAWGAAELGPLSKAPSRTRLRAYPGLSIVDAMSTLWLMDLKEAWAEGLHWIERSMPPYSSSLNRTLRVKEAVVDALGGLLSAYALSSEPVLLEKAMEVYLMLDHSEAFNRNTSFLAFKINPARGREVSMAFSYNKLASVGFEQSELIWLAHLTRNRRLQRRLAQIRSRLVGIGRQTSALYPSLLELGNGTATKDSVVSLSEDSRDFYYNMVRALMQRGGRESGDKELLLMYNTAIEAMQRRKMFEMACDGRLYVRDYDFKKRLILEDKGMDGSACQLGAMLALGAQQQTNRSTKRLHMQLAINLTETCYQAAMATTVKMVPKRFGAAGQILDVTAYLT